VPLPSTRPDINGLPSRGRFKLVTDLRTFDTASGALGIRQARGTQRSKKNRGGDGENES
jgi:hypothetical protein